MYNILPHFAEKSHLIIIWYFNFSTIHDSWWGLIVILSVKCSVMEIYNWLVLHFRSMFWTQDGNSRTLWQLKIAKPISNGTLAVVTTHLSFTWLTGINANVGCGCPSRVWRFRELSIVTATALPRNPWQFLWKLKRLSLDRIGQVLLWECGFLWTPWP